MATYYVSPTGSDAANGSESTPWATLFHAVLASSASDTINVFHGIYRDALLVDKDITISGDAQRFSILGGQDVSHGAVIGNRLRNGSLEGWLTSGPTGWTLTKGTGDVTKETTLVGDGLASAKFVRTAGTHYLAQKFYLEANTQYVLTLKHRETADSFRFKYGLVDDQTTDYYLQSDGSWSTTAYFMDDVGTSKDAWATYTKTFTSNRAGYYLLSINLGYSTTSYLDDVKVIPVDNAYSWSEYNDGIYVLDKVISREVKVVLACHADYYAEDIKNLLRLEVAADKDFLQPGQWAWASGLLYINPPTGVSISDLHIEAGRSLAQSDLEYCISITSPCELSNFNVFGASTNGIILSSAVATQAHLHDFYVHGCGKDNISDNILINGAALLEDFETSYGGVKGVLANGAAAACVCVRGVAHQNYSGGMYVYGGGSLRCDFCMSHHNGRELSSNNSGFNAHDGAANDLTLYHCTALSNYGRGVSISGSGDCVVKNCIMYGTVEGEGGDAHIASNFTGTLDKGHNIFGGSYPDWEPTATEYVVNPSLGADGKLASGISRASHSASVIAGVNDGAQTDPWGNTMLDYPNIGADQHDYAPGFGPWSTCDGILPTSAQPCKGHTLPIGVGKITIFDGVASASQIEEAK